MTGSLVHPQSQGIASLAAPGVSGLPPKATGESEKRLALPKASVETRRAGRRLVRPKLLEKSEKRPEELQGGDTEMSDAEGPGGKPGQSSDTDTSNVVQSSQQLARKRVAPTSTSELREESVAPGEREEGELLPDIGDLEGASDLSNIAENQESREGLSESAATPERSPATVDDDALEAGEINSPELSSDDKNDEGDLVEEAADGSDKLIDVNEPISAESDQVAEPVASETATLTSSVVESSSSKVNLPVPRGFYVGKKLNYFSLISFHRIMSGHGICSSEGVI